jgi:hypothetical protein
LLQTKCRPAINGFTVAEQIFVCGGGLFCDN